MLVNERMGMSQQCVLTAWKASCALGCTTRSVFSSLREGILPLQSALVGPYLQSCIQFWGTQFKKDMDLEINLEKSPDNGQKAVTCSI